MTTIAALRIEVMAWPALSLDERDAVRGLEISAKQVEFAGTMDKSIAACEAGHPSEVVGLAIRLEGAVVGWVVLKRGASAPDWVGADAVVVSGLRIDTRQQGRGIGAAALAEMARWIARHWPESSLLKLRVDDGNAAGIRAYEKAGWVEVGQRLQGRVGLERTMIATLRPSA